MPKPNTKDKSYPVRFSQQNIDAHGSEQNLKNAILAVRDLKKAELLKLIDKCK